MRIVAVYDADGTLGGELAYLAGKLLGTRHCALCDISHGWHPLGKRAWRRACGQGVQVQWLHRNEQSDALAQFTEGKLPLVLAERPEGYTVLLDRVALAGCRGDLSQFERLLADAIEPLGLD